MIRRLSILSLLAMALLPGALSARVILENENIVIEKAAQKIEEMGEELQQKTGVTLRIAAIQYLKNKETIRAHEEKVAADLKAPFVVFFFSAIDRKVDVYFSEDLKDRLDKDEILDDYVIPILVEKRKDMTDETRFSAAIFNGSTKIIGDLARSFHVKLNSVPEDPEEGRKKANTWGNVALQLAPVLAFILVTAYVMLRHRAKKG